MSSTKASGEGQMGSGESDDEFYNVKLPNMSTSVKVTKDTKHEAIKEAHSPLRTKVKYDYKFDSSSDDETDGHCDNKYSSSKTSEVNDKPVVSADTSSEDKKKEECSSDKSKLPETTSMVVEKINEELKSMKNSNGNNKMKIEKSDGPPISGSTAKHVPTNPVGVTTPVVVVPSPMVVPQSHSVMAMGAAGMIVPQPIGLPNQNVMIPPTSMLNLPGNVIRPNTMGGMISTAGSAIMNMGNPSMISPIQNQGNLVGMTNDLLQLRGNLMGITAPGNVMQMPTGLCMTGNMIPVQGNIAALQSNIIGLQGAANNLMANQTIINNQGSIIGNPGVITNPGGVMMSPANVMTVNNIMNNQGNIMNNVGNIMLNMNSLVSSPGTRMNYPENLLNAQGMNMVGNRNISNEIGKAQVHYTDSQTKPSEKDWHAGTKPHPGSDQGKRSSKSPSPSDSDRNWDGNDDDDDGTNVKETTNTFKNDGSFMEMFKKMSEANNIKGSSNKDESSSTENNDSDVTNVKKPSVMLSGIVGKRRGGRVLKTGLVKKVKKDSEAEEEKGPKDAWAMYMAEVKKYREASCEEEGKTRPLVK